MKRTLGFALGALLIAEMCAAQGSQSEGSGSTSQGTAVSANQSNGQSGPSAGRLPAGSVLQVELIKPVDAQKNKAGDEVVARTTHDVKANGDVVIAKGSRLVGHVTEVKTLAKDQTTSEVRIVFDRAILKNGTDVSMVLLIQALGRARVAPPGESQIASGTTNVAPGGLLGGVGSTTIGAANDVGGSARSAGLAPTSQGVMGLRGLTLSNRTSATDSMQESIISSSTSDVHLDSGTEMILRASQ